MYGKVNYVCPIITPDRFHTSLVGLKCSIKTLFYTYIQNKGQPPPPKLSPRPRRPLTLTPHPPTHSIPSQS